VGPGDPVKTIGLTGGIGSGKSTVARMLADLGAEVIDADRIGHEVYRPGTTGFRLVTGAFGDSIVAGDGSIDRRRLGSIVFADSAKLALLNGIVHPLIRDAIRERIAGFRADRRLGKPVIVEAALLIEASWAALVDEVWAVIADPAVVLARVTAERGLAPAEVEARIRAQITDDERRRRSDVVIDNSGTVEQLRERVATLWRTRVEGAAAAP
jgi:dephospho-CoA kinase